MESTLVRGRTFNELVSLLVFGLVKGSGKGACKQKGIRQ